MGDQTPRSLAVELTERMRASTTVDWQYRESVRAAMRLRIKRLLKKYKYPPEGQDDAVALVIKQTAALVRGEEVKGRLLEVVLVGGAVQKKYEEPKSELRMAAEADQHH